MMLNDWMILNVDIQGLRKELIKVYLKVPSLHWHLDQVRLNGTPRRYMSDVWGMNHLNWWLQQNNCVTVIKQVKNSFGFHDTENVYSAGASNLDHLCIYCLVIQTHGEDCLSVLVLYLLELMTFWERFVYVVPLFFFIADASHKIGFDIKLALVCSEPWVECPAHLNLMNITRIFTVRIDPTGLPTGVHASRYCL